MADIWAIGHSFPSFWRPATATVRIGNRVERGLHMIQVWQLRTDGTEEVLVLYPQDGYWAARPLALRPLRNTAYGSSFLVGPIAVEGRPIVKIKEVAFDPKTRSFAHSFGKGPNATVRMASLDQNRMALDIGFAGAIAGGPFAMLRSMYVTEFNNDVARVAVREKFAKKRPKNDPPATPLSPRAD